MGEPVTHTPVEGDELGEKWTAWLDLIESHHHASNHRSNPEVAFTPLTKPLAESTVALVTTAGAHLDDHEPFDVATTAGDHTHRLIPHGTDPSRLRFTHTHYDTAPAEEDPNVVLPIRALDQAIQQGRVGAAAQHHIGMMGFNPDPSKVADETAPLVAELLNDQGVDIALLIPG